MKNLQKLEFRRLRPTKCSCLWQSPPRLHFHPYISTVVENVGSGFCNMFCRDCRQGAVSDDSRVGKSLLASHSPCFLPQKLMFLNTIQAIQAAQRILFRLSLHTTILSSRPSEPFNAPTRRKRRSQNSGAVLKASPVP